MVGLGRGRLPSDGYSPPATLAMVFLHLKLSNVYSHYFYANVGSSQVNKLIIMVTTPEMARVEGGSPVRSPLASGPCSVWGPVGGIGHPCPGVAGCGPCLGTVQTTRSGAVAQLGGSLKPWAFT